MNKSSSYKVLITCVDATGHFNTCLGVGSLLLDRGHQVYFAHYEHKKSTIEKHGFNYVSLKEFGDKNYDLNDSLLDEMEPLMEKMFEQASKFSPLENLKEEIRTGHSNDADGFILLLETSKGENISMMNIVEKIKPDVCIVDQVWYMPWMAKASCPVVRVWSGSPNDLYNGPPMGSGYSVNDSPELWAEFRRLKDKTEESVIAKARELFQFFDAPFNGQYCPKDLGIYVYPGPLDYHELGSPIGNWVRLESSIRAPETSNFEIPAKLANKEGKLIYVSMGTISSSIVKLMKMIINTLGKSPNRFIVSTGKYGDTIELYDNMWGDKYVNQVALLPKVDLFITHGGNNSVVEGLAAGKPLLVIPQFGDQFDNAQRIVDLKLGTKVCLHEFSEEKLLKAIEDVLNDETIHENVARISKEIIKSDSSDKVISLIEQLCLTNEKNKKILLIE